MVKLLMMLPFFLCVLCQMGNVLINSRPGGVVLAPNRRDILN